MDAFKPLIAKVASGASLTEAEASEAFELIFSGEVAPAQLGAFLMALRLRGETIDEITGAVRAMRARMLRVEAPPRAIDIVGTGGDGHATYNVSTLAALIVAACGVPVAKHGNRAASSRSGSSDVLALLGVRIGLPPAGVEACIREAGIGFMSAQTHHAAMRHVAPVRAELGVRTIFNLLGPLANPAGVKYQMLGVYAASWLEPLAQALHNLGSKRVWLVHGADGLDEASTTGPSFVTASRRWRDPVLRDHARGGGPAARRAFRPQGRNARRQRGGAAGRAGRRKIALSRHRAAERGGGPRRRRKGRQICATASRVRRRQLTKDAPRIRCASSLKFPTARRVRNSRRAAAMGLDP